MHASNQLHYVLALLRRDRDTPNHIHIKDLFCVFGIIETFQTCRDGYTPSEIARYATRLQAFLDPGLGDSGAVGAPLGAGAIKPLYHLVLKSVQTQEEMFCRPLLRCSPIQLTSGVDQPTSRALPGLLVSPAVLGRFEGIK